MKLRQQAKRIAAMRAKRPKFWTAPELAWFDEQVEWIDNMLGLTGDDRRRPPKPEGDASAPWTPSPFY